MFRVIQPYGSAEHIEIDIQQIQHIQAKRSIRLDTEFFLAEIGNHELPFLRMQSANLDLIPAAISVDS